MKNIFRKLGFLIFAGTLMVSCDDQIDIDPIGFLSDENTFETVENLQQGLNGAYARLTTQQNNIQFDIMTDEVKVGADNGGQYINFYNFNLNNQTGEAAVHWTSNYAVINQVNRVLDGVETVELEEGDQETVDNILGQLYALRAYAHWELLQWFATDYLDGNSLAVPYVDFVVTIEELPRNTVSEVMAGINSDLAQAENLLADSNGITLVNRDMLTALKARMNLYTENFAQAQTFAQQLIDKYDLADRDQYQAMFNDADNTEVIFKLRRVAGNFPIGALWYFTGSAGPFLEMSNGLFDALDQVDIRYNVNLWEEESDPANNSHLVGKYTGPGFLNDLKVFRVSEMYLIKAEAQARTGDLPGAALTIKELRDARFDLDTTLDSYASELGAVQAILDERRVELAFEGHRYLDLRRTRDLTGEGIVRDSRDCPSGNCELSPSDFRFNLPIPLAELNANENMEQNPGYGS
jgi:hypothetical protein